MCSQNLPIFVLELCKWFMTLADDCIENQTEYGRARLFKINKDQPYAIGICNNKTKFLSSMCFILCFLNFIFYF